MHAIAWAVDCRSQQLDTLQAPTVYSKMKRIVICQTIYFSSFIMAKDVSLLRSKNPCKVCLRMNVHVKNSQVQIDATGRVLFLSNLVTMHAM